MPRVKSHTGRKKRFPKITLPVQIHPSLGSRYAVLSKVKESHSARTVQHITNTFKEFESDIQRSGHRVERRTGGIMQRLKDEFGFPM